MSGPSFRNGGPRGEGDDGLPRVPYQREQSGVPDGLGYRSPRRPEQVPPRPSQQQSQPQSAPAEQPQQSQRQEQQQERDQQGPEQPKEPPKEQPLPQAPHFDHGTLKSLLGAWALTVCSRDEALAVEVHLTDCAACAEEGLRLRDAVRLLHQEESLDLDPLLRARVLEGCLGRRPARIPVPEWAGPYDAEAARLDALLRDLGDRYWNAPVELRWFEGAPVTRQFTVAQVIAHLAAVDGLAGRAMGLPAPGANPVARTPRPGLDGGPAGHARPRRVSAESGEPGDPEESGESGVPVDLGQRTAAYWRRHQHLPGATHRLLWREQTHNLVRTVSFAGHGVAGLGVQYGAFTLPLRDALVDRAFECWIHAGDIAKAVDYPYEPPAPRNLHRMIDLAARLLPDALAERRRAGLTVSPARLTAAGAPGRSLDLEIEGDGGGHWYLPLDSPGAVGSAAGTVAHVAMDTEEFCQLAAGHIAPERVAAGQQGDRAVIRDVLFATASLSRL